MTVTAWRQGVQRLRIRPRGAGKPADKLVIAQPARRADAPPVDIAPNDPIVAYFLSAPGAVELETLKLDSPALRGLLAAGVKLVIPLVSQGELVGLLNLGPRMSQQEYSADDRGLLNTLATQAAPAVRVAQLVREQQAEARARERIENELRVVAITSAAGTPLSVTSPITRPSRPSSKGRKS